MSSWLSGFRVGVLGGTRFIGWHLVQALLEAGAGVSIFHRGRTAEPRPFRGPVERFIGDRGRPASLEAFFSRSYDAVVDLSGYAPSHVEPVLSRWRGHIGHYLFCSTAYVHAPQAGGAYAADKALCEAAILEASRTHTWPATILRPQLVFGSFDAPAPLYAARRLLAGEPVLVQAASAGQRACPLLVEDLAAMFLAAMADPNGSCGAFDAAGPEALDPEGFVRLMASVLPGSSSRCITLGKDLSSRLPDLGLPWPKCDLVPEVSGSRLGTGSTSLSEALRRTLDWARSEPGCLRLVQQRWELQAREGRLPGRADELAWRLCDAVKANALWGLARGAARALGLRSRYR